ncbi:MAG TPA: MCE family protein [Streptosporangiaceae bacterium]|jgi:phospholipid/cholesterol/gamma-HCH transport system substrate-binding protein
MTQPTATVTRRPPAPPPPSRHWFKTRRRLTGVVFLLVMALLVWLSIALYQKQFTPVAMVTLYTNSVGNEMHLGAEVKVRGVQVGEVRAISATGTGAQLELAIDPAMLPRLPANVTAEMLPTTLFGERYVDLLLPAQPAAQTLAAGSVIQQDHSADALELEKVLNDLLPMLNAVEPDKLSLTLTAIAHGVSGRGAELGRTLTTLNTYLHTMNPQLPKLDTDIKRLAGLARTYNQATPAILSALNDFSATSQIVASERASYAALLSNLTTASGDLKSFLDANSGNAIHLSAASVATLRILARYAPEFPCTLAGLARFIPSANRLLGKGTRQPGLHVNVIVVPPRAAYRPGKDTPVYGDDLGPHCYRTPFPGIHLNDGTSRGHARAGGKTAGTTATTRAMTGFGAAGSPQESEMARELAALALGQRPASLPGWSGLLVAPLYRGTSVRLGANRA